MDLKQQEKDLDKLIDLLEIDYYEDKNFVLCNGKIRINGDFYTYESALEKLKNKDCNRIGLWIPKGFLVVDTDTVEASKIVGKYVKEKGMTTPVIKTAKGYHFFFKYEGNMTQMVKGTVNLGCEVDYRVADKGYVILPINDKNRVIKQIGDIDNITHKLLPVNQEKNVKSNKKNKISEKNIIENTKKVEFLSGSRNDNLFRYLCGFVNNTQLRDYNNMLMLAIGINQTLCNPPLETTEVERIVTSVIETYAPDTYIDDKGKIIPYVLAETIAKDFNCISDNISSYIYNGKSYEEIPNCYYKIIDKYIENKKLIKTSMTNEVTNQIYKQTYTGTIENQRGYINFKNGIYDLKSRSLIDHTKDIITLGINNGNYNKNCSDIKGTKFEKYLKSSLSEDLIPVVQEMLGVCLYPLTDKVHYFYIFTGCGRNGKGVMLSIIENLIPSNLRSGITMADYDTRFANSSIKGKQINLCTDDNTTRLEGIGNLKSVTAGEGIFTEKKGKDGEMIKAYLTHISSFNELPSVKEKAPALFDRMIVIPFNKTFGTTEEVAKGEKDLVRDPLLKEQILKNELDIIINWALAGLLRVIDNGYVFTTSKSSADKKEEYLTSVDSSLEWIKENVTTVEGLSIDRYIKGSQMFEHYKTWCKKEDKHPLGKQKFFDSLRVKLRSNWKSHNNADKYAVKLKYIGLKTHCSYDSKEDLPF